MARESANKALIVLQTSLLVSLICSVASGFYYTYLHDRTWTQLLYASYIIMVNKTVFPVGMTTIVYCFVVPGDWKNLSMFRIATTALILSLVSLTLLFIWNSVDECLKFGFCPTGGEDFYQNIRQQFLLGIFLCVPVSLLIISLFSYFSRIRE